MQRHNKGLKISINILCATLAHILSSSPTGFVLDEMSRRNSVQSGLLFFFLAECRFYGVCWLCNMADFFPNVTPVALSFCPLPASILQSASLWVETPSSGRQTSPPLRWRWPDCSLHPVENTHYKLNMLKLASIDLIHSSLHQGCNQLLLSPSLRIVVTINRLCFGV